MTLRQDDNAGKALGRSTRLEVLSLTKRYGDLLALDDLSLTVEPGVFQALLGPSGSGKTSLLMSIAGFLRPDTGKILVNGADVVHLPPERRNFGMVFQGYALFPHLSVLDNVAFALRARGISAPERRKRAGAAIDLVRLSGRENHYPRQLSGGQQQRVALARAIAFQPDLLLLDEPLSALDRALRSELQTELRSLQKTTGLTCVYVTHDQDEALSMADVVAVLTAGRITQIGTPVDLYERPSSRFVASFLGKSNFLELEPAGQQGDLVIGTRGGALVRHRGAVPGGTGAPMVLTLRPEKIAIAEAAELPGHNVVRARVIDVSYLGSAIELIADAGPLGRLIVRAPASDISRVDPGRDIGLAWREDAAVALRPDA